MEDRRHTHPPRVGLRDSTDTPSDSCRRLIIDIVVGVLLLCGVTLLISPTRASAAGCDESYAGARGRIATTSAQCDQDQESPSPGGAAPSPADRWNAYCASYRAYTPGAGVSIIQGAQATGTTQVSAGVTPDLITTGHTTTINIPTTGTYHHYSIQCTWPPGGLVVYNTLLPTGTPVSPIALRNQVLATITIDDPTPAGSPPLTERFSVVRIPTWLWLDQPLDPITATDTQGPLTVTVTGAPLGVRWDTGDGAHEDCPIQQIAWRDGLPEDATNCSHTYTRSTAGLPNDALELTATVTWEFTWTLNGTPQGPFGTYDATTTIEHQVGEIVAVNRYTTPSP